jgi:hypothetical protein
MKLNLLVPIVVIFACGISLGATSEPPDLEMSFDGLYRRQSSVFDELWVRKQFDVHDYHKVMLVPPFIEYRPLMRAQSDPNAAKPLPPSKRQQEALQQTVNAAFREELAKSKYFKLVDEAGPDVLTVRGDLVDVVSYVATNSSPTDALTVPVAGEAILVIELYDSSSNAIMVRASDRVAAKREADNETADQVVRATATAWARTFRERLDEAASIPVMAAPS